MGLDIQSTNKSYHWGYSGLHQLRTVAYKIMGGEKEVGAYQKDSFDWGFVAACVEFPNLMLHSDCGGTYSTEGKVDLIKDQDLLGGSLPALQQELRKLWRHGKRDMGERETTIFKSLKAVVDDAIKTGMKKIELR